MVVRLENGRVGNRAAPGTVDKMKAVVLAAGEGLRMRPLTHSMPKVMLRVAGRPILEYGIRALVGNGIREIVMVVGYKRDQIMSYFEDGGRWGAEIEYVVEEKQLGTSHAVLQAEGRVDGDFIVYPGDNILRDEMLSLFLSRGEGMSVLVVESDRPSKYGVVMTAGGNVRGIEPLAEPEVASVINTGTYRFTPEVFGYIERTARRGSYALGDVIVEMIRDGVPVRAVKAPGRWFDAVYPWDLIDASVEVMGGLQQRIEGVVSGKSTIQGPVAIGEGSVVKPGAYLEGPVLLGKGCEVGPNTVIGPFTCIGDNVKIEAFSRIERSLIMEDVTIGSFSDISHSIIARGVVVEGGFHSLAGPASIYGARDTEGDVREVVKVERLGV
ncbi:MAG: NTP transferase domain-containing protein, partial [Thermoplasmata archaeon]|nr:NTP transferase domain-containing protein [Thermoplasmata archaeon]